MTVTNNVPGTTFRAIFSSYMNDKTVTAKFKFKIQNNLQGTTCKMIDDVGMKQFTERYRSAVRMLTSLVIVIVLGVDGH